MDWNGMIRLFNISTQTCWSTALKSSEIQSPKIKSFKRLYLSFNEMDKLTQGKASKFYPCEVKEANKELQQINQTL